MKAAAAVEKLGLKPAARPVGYRQNPASGAIEFLSSQRATGTEASAGVARNDSYSDDEPAPATDDPVAALENKSRATDGVDLPSEALLDEFTEEELLPDPAKPEPYEYVEKTDRTGVAYVEVRSGGKLVGRFEKRTGTLNGVRTILSCRAFGFAVERGHGLSIAIADGLVDRAINRGNALTEGLLA